MRIALTLAFTFWVGTFVFSSPIPRMLLKRGLFDETLQLNHATASQVAAQLTNALTSNASACQPMQDFFQLLADGENAGGATTIGDRAVAGARKLLNLQSAGQGGLVQMVQLLANGSLTNQTKTALAQAFTNPPRTLASLQTYKFLVDTQSALANMSTLITQVGGNQTALTFINNAMLPVLTQVENAIDDFGSAFSVQDLANQTAQVENIINLVNKGGQAFAPLLSSNAGDLSSVTTAIQTAQSAMNNLASAAANASSLADSPPTFPLDTFNFIPGTACTTDGPAVAASAPA